MHGKGHHDGSTGGVEVKNIMGENACNLADESDEAKTWVYKLAEALFLFDVCSFKYSD